MSDRTGQQFGNYHLLRLLGKGGFAEVYLGEHRHLATQAAIKVLLAHLDSQVDIEGFRREAQIIAQLTHPHIVRVLDFDVEQGVPFLVMEYAPRGSLRAQFPKGTRLPLATVVTCAHQVAEALQYAHERRLIHRDVKPDNMLLRNDGSIILSDFGIVAIAHSTSSRRMEGRAGTPGYMAPEQMNGEPRPTSDQYALAVTVYEWICGQLPFQGTALEVAMQHMMKSPPSLVQQIPTLPQAVEQVVFTALAKDPKERFSTIQAFATALEQAVNGEQDIETFVRPDHPPRPSAPSDGTPGASGALASGAGIHANPPTKSQPDPRAQVIVSPPGMLSSRQSKDDVASVPHSQHPSVRSPQSSRSQPSAPSRPISASGSGALGQPVPNFPSQWPDKPIANQPLTPNYPAQPPGNRGSGQPVPNLPSQWPYRTPVNQPPASTTGPTTAGMPGPPFTPRQSSVKKALPPIAILGTCLLLTVVLVSLAIFSGASLISFIRSHIPSIPSIPLITDNNTPEGLIDNFCGNLSGGDYRSAYDKYSKHLQDQVTFTDFQNYWSANNKQYYHIDRCDHQTNQTPAGNSVTASWSTHEFYSGAVQYYSITFVAQGSDGWKIDQVTPTN